MLPDKFYDFLLYSLFFFFHKFFLENVSAVNHCVFEGLRILLYNDGVSRNINMHLNVLVLVIR